MTKKKLYQLIVAFKESDGVIADVTSDQLAIICQLGILKPLRLWSKDSKWPNRPDVRIVFLTVRRSENGSAISRPVDASAARSAQLKLTDAMPHFEGMSDSVHYVKPNDDFGGRLFRSDDYTIRMLRNIALLQISGEFPDWLDGLDVDPDPESEPELETKPDEPTRPAWPGIDRPARF